MFHQIRIVCSDKSATRIIFWDPLVWLYLHTHTHTHTHTPYLVRLSAPNLADFSLSTIIDVCSDLVILTPLQSTRPRHRGSSGPRCPPRGADGATPIVTGEEIHVALARLEPKLPLLRSGARVCFSRPPRDSSAPARRATPQIGSGMRFAKLPTYRPLSTPTDGRTTEPPSEPAGANRSSMFQRPSHAKRLEIVCNAR